MRSFRRVDAGHQPTTQHVSYAKQISMPMDQLLAIQCFVRVSECGSFSAAGRSLGRPQSQVSRLVSQLESVLGGTLLERTTRQVSLTQSGQEYLECARRALAELDEGASLVASGKASMRGRVRIATTNAIARQFLMDVVERLIQQFDELRIDLKIDDHVVDIVGEGVDIAVRMGNLAQTDVVARKLCDLPRIVVASPGYLKRWASARPPIVSPEALEHHDCLLFTGWPSQRFAFRDDDRTIDIVVNGRLSYSVGELARDAAIRGLGVGLVPAFLCESQIASGQLVRLLPGFALDPVPLHAVYTTSRRQVGRVAAVLDALLERFSDCPGPSST
jgi:DNA-binding transcriptional LysR family regulator